MFDGLYPKIIMTTLLKRIDAYYGLITPRFGHILLTLEMFHPLCIGL